MWSAKMMWWAVLGLAALTALTACGAAPRQPQLDPVEVQRQRYAAAQAKVAEFEAAAAAPYAQREEAKVALVGALTNASVVWTDAAETALASARETRDEACRLDPSSCVEAQPVLTQAPPPPAPVLLLRINDFSAQGVIRLPGSANWKVEVELDKWVHVYLPGGQTEAAIKVEDCSLPVCVRMDAHGDRQAIACPE